MWVLWLIRLCLMLSSWQTGCDFEEYVAHVRGIAYSHFAVDIKGRHVELVSVLSAKRFVLWGITREVHISFFSWCEKRESKWTDSWAGFDYFYYVRWGYGSVFPLFCKLCTVSWSLASDQPIKHLGEKAYEFSSVESRVKPQNLMQSVSFRGYVSVCTKLILVFVFHLKQASMFQSPNNQTQIKLDVLFTISRVCTWLVV